MSGDSSGLVRSGPSVDMNRKRIRVAPSTARMRFDKPGDTQLRGDAAKKVCKRSPSTSENLVFPRGESENLQVGSSNAAAPQALVDPQVRGKIRQRDTEIESANPAMAEAPVVHSATERASEPPHKRQHAQPRPVGGLLDNPPSATWESD